MSNNDETPRFLACGYDAEMKPFASGDWVRYEDYAHLKDELKMEKENEDRLVREWQKANNEVYGLQRQVAALIDDQTRLKDECQARQAENSVLAVECDTLKAEVERLTLIQAETLSERNKAEAEVERLQFIHSIDSIGIEQLKAEVERLTKAGDAMANIIKGPAHGPGEWDGEWDNWQEAKKGGQP